MTRIGPSAARCTAAWATAEPARSMSGGTESALAASTARNSVWVRTGMRAMAARSGAVGVGRRGARGGGGARREHGIAGFRKQVRVVAAVVQPAAFVPRQGRAHDELRGEHEVAKLDQVVRDAEVGVELGDL